MDYMGLFDPQPAKPKMIKRHVYKFPENLNRKLFLYIYLGSLIFWMMAIGLIGVLIFIILLPMVFDSLPAVYVWMAVSLSAVIGAVIGSLMGSMVINSIIQEGIKKGEINVLNNT